MSASFASGSYGHRPAFTGAIRKFLDGLLGGGSTAESTRASYLCSATTFRARVRQGKGARELARSVEQHSPGFAAELSAAASRSEASEG